MIPRLIHYATKPPLPSNERETMNNAKSFHIVSRTALLAALMLAPVAAPAASTDALVASNTAFAGDLYSRLKTADGNLFFSPYSISTCLGMTYTGARGDTATQMASVFHFDADPAQFSASFAALQSQLNRLQKKSSIELNIANGLWAQKDHPFQSAFLKNAERDFSAKLNQVDFRTSAEPARNDINDWVSRQTKGKITDLLQPGILDASTRLVLVNAIYFKGHWTHQFKKDNTEIEPFHPTPDQQIDAPLMHIDKPFKYAETDTCQSLELPYVSGNVAMDIFLPKELGGLKKLEDSLDLAALTQQLTQVRKQDVTVILPKFKLTSQFNLTDTLAAMGMPKPFSDQADFSGMDGQRDLYISAVVHKAYVDLDEEGTEAAAATGSAVNSLSMAPIRQQPVFRADHPFIFLIRDTQSGAILFLGRVTDPTK